MLPVVLLILALYPSLCLLLPPLGHPHQCHGWMMSENSLIHLINLVYLHHWLSHCPAIVVSKKLASVDALDLRFPPWLTSISTLVLR